MWASVLERRDPEIFNGLDLKSLAVDECFLKIVSQANENLSLFQKSSDCHKCPYVRNSDLSFGEAIDKTYDSNPYWNFLISSSSEDYISSPQGDPKLHCLLEDVDLGEFGVYELNITNTKCMLETVKDPVFKYAALFWTFGVLFVFFLFYVLIDFILERRRKIKEADPEGLSENEVMKADIVKPRIKSLDAFRGLTIILMILVNYGGGHFWFLHHPPWDGIRLADIVFPWFVWIMGVCIPFSINSQLKSSSRCKILLNILKRSVKLFILGIILNSIGGHNEISTYRIFGVLQRLSLGYLIGATVYCLTYFSRVSNEKYIEVPGPRRFFAYFDDIISLIPQWFFYCLITAGYLAVVFLLPVPGCPTGYLGPAGLTLFKNGSATEECVGGATGYVDLLILGNNHLYQYPSSQKVYQSGAFDPEGILGVLPTALQVFLGIQAGQIMVNHKSPKGRLLRWLIWGIIYFVIGLGLSGGTFTGHPIPVNKNLWSLSFVFVTSSWAFILLLLCYLFIDHLKVLSGAPFYQTGMNCIFLYVGHFFTYNVFPWQFSFYGEFDTHIGLFAEAMWATILWVLIALYMHWRKIFIIV